ncbi:hypothetical protein EG68_05195 [Paragonimus skrjabini miyazakii]|uniref:Uncharacterized protein n=1 Tax=Paragonimus skrjabini miyazakii TaxID=59628 RepID=A0A8S9YRR1_9TREM|nr:hypothetical protein EG68_05195 [Paragonimus skrjabini miyazakii]
MTTSSILQSDRPAVVDSKYQPFVVVRTTTLNTTTTSTTTTTTTITRSTTTTTPTTTTTTPATTTTTTPTTTTTTPTTTTTTPTKTTTTTPTTTTTTPTKTTTTTPTTTTTTPTKTTTTPTTTTVTTSTKTDAITTLPTNILYRATANHYWTFRNASADHWIVDGGPKQNHLSEAIYVRLNEYDAKLIQPGPIHDDVDNSEKSIFVALQSQNKPLEGTRFSKALGVDPERSIQLLPGDVNYGCIKLVDNLQQERYYYRQCLLSATNCDYGLSLAVWLQFLSPEVTNKEIIIATVKNKRDEALPRSVVTTLTQLHCDNIIATQLRSLSYVSRNLPSPISVISYDIMLLMLLVNKIVLAEKTHYTGQAVLGADVDPTALWLGCTVDENDVKISHSTTHGLEISSVTLWYWPLQLHQYITGGKELYLLGTKSKPPAPKPPEVVPDYADYTNVVEELVPLEGYTYPPNPMYLAADYYHSMQDELDTIQTNDATRNWEPMRKMYAYALTGPNGFIELKTFDNSGCPTSLDACTRGGGLSVGVWMQIPSAVLPSDYPVDVLELVGVLRVAIYKGTLNIFGKSNRVLKDSCRLRNNR